MQRSVANAETGLKRPWRLYQNYALDIVSLRFGKVDDGVMRYLVGALPPSPRLIRNPSISACQAGGGIR